MKLARISFTLLALTFFLTSPLAAQLVDHGGIDLRGDRQRFSIFVGAGYGLVDDFEEGAPLLEIEPRYELSRSDRHSLDFALSLLWLPESRPLPGAGDAALPGDVPSALRGELEAGQSLALIPSLEWTPRTLRCCRFSFFAGAGVVYEEGRESELAIGILGPDGVAADRIDIVAQSPDTVDPVITFGIALSRQKTERLELRAKLRFYTTFYDERSAETAFGEIVVPSTSSSGVLLTVGVRFSP